MSHSIRRAVAAGALTAIALTGAVAPANAADPATDCDPAVVNAAVNTASADARAAQLAFTTHTSTSMKALAKQLKRTEVREAKAAARQARSLARVAARTSDKQARSEARAAAKAAHVAARAEAKEAARVRRANRATMLALIKADRVRLKAQWDAAKLVLQAARAHADECAAAAPQEP